MLKYRFPNLHSLLTESQPARTIIAMAFTKALLCLFAALATFASAEPAENTALVDVGTTCADGATPHSLVLLQRSAAKEVGMQGDTCGLTRAMTGYTGCGDTFVHEYVRSRYRCGSGYGTSKLIFDSFNGGSSCGMTCGMYVYPGCGYTYVAYYDREDQCGSSTISVLLLSDLL